jgi:hypothetical protein
MSVNILPTIGKIERWPDALSVGPVLVRLLIDEKFTFGFGLTCGKTKKTSLCL